MIVKSHKIKYALAIFFFITLSVFFFYAGSYSYALWSHVNKPNDITKNDNIVSTGLWIKEATGEYEATATYNSGDIVWITRNGQKIFFVVRPKVDNSGNILSTVISPPHSPAIGSYVWYGFEQFTELGSVNETTPKNWSISTDSYFKGDVVVFNNNYYIVNNPLTRKPGANGIFWFTPPYSSDYTRITSWISSRRYTKNDVVQYNGNYYRALQATTNVIPGTNSNHWIHLQLRSDYYNTN